MEKDAYYEKVKDIMTREHFEYEIEERRKKYGDLLDDEAISLIILDELGKFSPNWIKIGDLIDGVNASLIVEVVSIEDSSIKKNERDLKLRRIRVKDETGECTLVLWNEEIENYGNIAPGDKIKIINCFTKLNHYGLQISLGKWGNILKI